MMGQQQQPPTTLNTMGQGGNNQNQTYGQVPQQMPSYSSQYSAPAVMQNQNTNTPPAYNQQPQQSAFGQGQQLNRQMPSQFANQRPQMPQQAAFGRGQQMNRQMPSQYGNRQQQQGLQQIPRMQQQRRQLEQLRINNPRMYQQIMMRQQQQRGAPVANSPQGGGYSSPMAGRYPGNY